MFAFAQALQLLAMLFLIAGTIAAITAESAGNPVTAGKMHRAAQHLMSCAIVFVLLSISLKLP